MLKRKKVKVEKTSTATSINLSFGNIDLVKIKLLAEIRDLLKQVLEKLDGRS